MCSGSTTSLAFDSAHAECGGVSSDPVLVVFSIYFAMMLVYSNIPKVQHWGSIQFRTDWNVFTYSICDAYWLRPKSSVGLYENYYLPMIVHLIILRMRHRNYLIGSQTQLVVSELRSV